MPFTVIRGTYHIKNYSPDGDSIRFQADDNSNWLKLQGRVDVNARGHAQLRLEAIDTLETHFQGMQQPPDLAIKALDFLLLQLGIRQAVFDPLMMNVTSAEDGTPGYILAREAERNGRPVAFAFTGEPQEGDGDSVFFNSARLKESVNFKSVAEGFAYPTYYQGLFPDLRDTLTQATLLARAAGSGVWGEDRTLSGFDVPDLRAITERQVILPKLFRRLGEFMRGGGSVAGFKRFLELRREPITILPTAHFTHFDTIIEVSGDVVRMTRPPENVVFAG